jgi:hypothetical protein
MRRDREVRAAPGREQHGVLLAGVLLLGAWLRLHNFDRPGLWIDEYGSWWVVAADGYAGVAARAWEIQGQSPLYYLILRGVVDLCGLASWSLRLPSLVLGILVPWLGYLATRALFRDRRLGVTAAAALAVHAPLIRYAQEARPYALALALSLASFALFARVLRGSGLAGRAGYVLATAGSFYAHYLFGFALLVQAGYALCRRSPERRRVLAALGMAGLLAAPGGLQLAQIFGRRHSLDWAPNPASVPDALGAVLQAFIDPWPLALAVFTVVLLLAFGARAWRGDPGDHPGLVLAWLFVPLAVVLLAPAALDVNLLERRYLLFAAPAARILVGLVLAVPRRGPLADALPLGVFIAATIFWVLLPQHAHTGTFALRKDQHWDTAVGEMLADYRAGDRVLFSSGYVEMDLLVEGTARPATRAFATWPLMAHVPAGVALPYTPLPFSVSAATRPVLERIAGEAFTAPRVWVLGAGPSVREIAKHGAADPRIRVVRNDRHGSVRLVLLGRR